MGDDIDVTKLTFCELVVLILMDLVNEKADVVKIELVADVETEEHDVTIEAAEDVTIGFGWDVLK